MWTATYVTPDPNMPKVFMPSDNYERFLPTLAKRYEKTFNPFRLKVRIHLGVDADDPINRGTTPDYNDCFFNCAGQKPNYVDLFATAGGLSRTCIYVRQLGLPVSFGPPSFNTGVVAHRAVLARPAHDREQKQAVEPLVLQLSLALRHVVHRQLSFHVKPSAGMQNIVQKLCETWSADSPLLSPVP